MFLNLSPGEFLAIFGAIAAVSVALYLLDRNRRKQVVSTLRFWVTPGLPSPVTRRRKIQQPISLLLQLLGMLLLLLAIAELHWGGFHASAPRPCPDHRYQRMDARRRSRPTERHPDGSGPRQCDFLAARRARFRSRLASSRRRTGHSRHGWEIESRQTWRAPFWKQKRARQRSIWRRAWSLRGSCRSRAARLAARLRMTGRAAFAPETQRPECRSTSRFCASCRCADPSENVGLRSVGARRSGSTRDSWDLLVRLRNYGKTSRAVNVTLNYGHAPMGLHSVTLPPGGEQETTFELHSKAAGLAEVRIYPQDAFAADNYASLELPPQRSLHVVVYSDSPEEWRPALESDPRVAPEFRKKTEYTSANDGLVILDRFRPEQTPGGNTLWIDPPERSPIAIREHVTEPTGLRWAPDQALSAGLREHDLQIPSTAILETGTNDIRVAEVDRGPVIAARMNADGKTKTVVMGFNPFAGSLRYELAAPLLLANELRWFAPDVFRDVDVTAQSAGTVTDTLTVTPGADVQVITDAGTNLPFNIRDGKIQFFTGQCGTRECDFGLRRTRLFADSA